MYKNNLYVVRKEANKTQAEIAQELGMNTNVYSRYERGDRDLPLSVAIQIANLFDVSLDYIACRSVSPLGIQADKDNKYLYENAIQPLIESGDNEKEALVIVANNLRQSIKEATDMLDKIEQQIIPDNQ